MFLIDNLRKSSKMAQPQFASQELLISISSVDNTIFSSNGRLVWSRLTLLLIEKCWKKYRKMYLKSFESCPDSEDLTELRGCGWREGKPDGEPKSYFALEAHADSRKWMGLGSWSLSIISGKKRTKLWDPMLLCYQKSRAQRIYFLIH